MNEDMLCLMLSMTNDELESLLYYIESELQKREDEQDDE